MSILRLREDTCNLFQAAPELTMDVQLGRSEDERLPTFAIVGGRVAVQMDGRHRGELEKYLDVAWMQPGLASEEREALFETWLSELQEAPILYPATPDDLRGVWLIEPPNELGTTSMAFRLTPKGPMATPPMPSGPIYGHLPFVTRTKSDTVLYRWEAFPTSRRITRTGTAADIAKDTFAAPASEAPFAQTGFAAVARFALPSLLPARFRWELQPKVGTTIECGASVPLYGQSGGGVEVLFPLAATNRCPVASPVVLPVM